jgi:hypothetical protein
MHVRRIKPQLEEVSIPASPDPCEFCGRAKVRDAKLSPDVEANWDHLHDGCIPNLPGVRWACCGHGVREGYLVFEDGRTLTFDLRSVSTRSEEDDEDIIWMSRDIPRRFW